MKIKNKILGGALAVATIAAPIATVVSCGSSEDLSETIVVLAPKTKTPDGKVTTPMKTVYNKAIANWKKEHPEDAKKYKVVIKELDFSQYEKIATVGTTGASMPDIWFYPTDKMYLLKDKYDAIAPLSEYATKEIQHELGLKDNKKITFEKSNGKNYGVRFKNESVMMWGNAEVIDRIFATAQDFITKATSAKIANATAADKLTVDGKDFKLEKTLDLTKVKPSELIHAIQGKDLSESTSRKDFNEAKEKVAKFFVKAIDIQRFSKLAKKANSTNKYDKILPVAGENYWPMSGLVYSVGDPKKGGAEWKENGKEHSSFMNMKDKEYRPIFETWYDLAKNIPTDAKNVWDRFATGEQAFTIEGTWAQTSFTTTLKSDGKTKAIADTYNNLFEFPLPKVAGKQMRHYLQGWNFGINSRNQVDGEKYKATADLMAELFSTDTQEIFYNQRENYIPGNIKEGDLSKLQKEKQWNTSPLKMVNDAKDIYAVNRADIPKSYYEIEFDKKISNITKPLKPNASGKVNSPSFDDWADSTIKYLKTFGFVK